MSVLDGYRVVSEVRHRLALGLSFVDTAGGDPILGELAATVEQVGQRKRRLPMSTKAGGAALVLSRQVAALFGGPADTNVDVIVVIAPRHWPAPPLPRDRSVLPRRVRLPVRRNGAGLPAAEAPDHPGRWVFTVALHRGPIGWLAPGATLVTGRVVYPRPAGHPAEADDIPVRWAHIALRSGADTLATTRSDDRGEFALSIPGGRQPPETFAEIAGDLRVWAANAPPPPAQLAADPFADVPIEDGNGPLLPADTPPAGYAQNAADTPIRLMPGTALVLDNIVFVP